MNALFVKQFTIAELKIAHQKEMFVVQANA